MACPRAVTMPTFPANRCSFPIPWHRQSAVQSANLRRAPRVDAFLAGLGDTWPGVSGLRPGRDYQVVARANIVKNAFHVSATRSGPQSVARTTRSMCVANFRVWNLNEVKLSMDSLMMSMLFVFQFWPVNGDRWRCHVLTWVVSRRTRSDGGRRGRLGRWSGGLRQVVAK